MKYLKYSILVTTIFSVLTFAQDINDEGEPTTVKSLLELVQEGRTVEQDENSIREANFLAEKNKQAAILEAEKRELARQERIRFFGRTLRTFAKYSRRGKLTLF